MTTYIPSLTIPTSVLANPTASIILPIALGTAMGFSTKPSETQTTYLSLRQPPLRPPPWVFGPVWTILYGLMGYAAHRAISVGLSPTASPATVAATKHGATLYTIQLGLNLLWMPLFFGIGRPIEATFDIIALLGTNGYLTYIWGGVDPVVGWCFAPYIAWLGFATYLSAGVGYLNNWKIKRGSITKKQE